MSFDHQAPAPGGASHTACRKGARPGPVSSGGVENAPADAAAPSTTRYAGGSPPPVGEDLKKKQKAVCKSARASRRTSAVAFVEDEPDADDPLLGFAPFLHPVPRRNSITPDRQRAFIATLAATGIVTQAARSIGASLEALYKLRHRAGAEGFCAAWDKALDRGMMRLEDCALERAIQGEVRPVVSQGKLVTTWVRHDTALILFLLRQRRADRYGTAAEIAREAARLARDTNSDAILDAINAKIELMKVRRLAAEEREGE